MQEWYSTRGVHSFYILLQVQLLWYRDTVVQSLLNVIIINVPDVPVKPTAIPLRIIGRGDVRWLKSNS